MEHDQTNNIEFGQISAAEARQLMQKYPNAYSLAKTKTLTNGVGLLGLNNATFSASSTSPKRSVSETFQSPYTTVLPSTYHPEASTSKSPPGSPNRTKSSKAPAKPSSRKTSSQQQIGDNGLPFSDNAPANSASAPPVSFAANLNPHPKAQIPNIQPKSSVSTDKAQVFTDLCSESNEQKQPVDVVASSSGARTPDEISTSLPATPSKQDPKPSSLQVSPTKSAMKPKSWADLVRPAQTAPKRVSIALPVDVQSVASSSTLEEIPQTNSQSTFSQSASPFYTPPAPLSHSELVAAGQQAVSAAKPPPPKKQTLEDILRGVENRHWAPTIQPRGIVNQGNMCFENSIFQVLLFCAPFYNLLRLLVQSLPHDIAGRAQVLEATLTLLEEYKPVLPTNPGALSEWVEPFVPQAIYDALKQNQRFSAMQQGRQEDAQEFLGFFLDTLHEELLAAMDRYSTALEAKTQVNGTENHTGGAEQDGWLEVGKQGRTATTRKAEFRQSPITRIFGGTQRSYLRVPGQKDSATVEPFLTLQLDIQERNVDTIEDALENLTAPETVSDFVVRGGIKVEATKQLFLEELPPVLILHLKRFSYNNVGGTIKNHKVVGYQTELEISPSILAPASKTTKAIKYHLTAVVYHHGKSATGGHYTAAVCQQNDQWINVDDTHISHLSPADVAVNRVDEVLRLSLPSASMGDGLPDRSAYLLFYSRG